MTIKKATTKKTTKKIVKDSDPYITRREDHFSSVVKLINSDTEVGGDVALDIFCNLFSAVSTLVHNTAKEKGWWDSKRSDGECLALIHGEVSETLEALRSGNPKSEHIPEFTGAEEELADVIIRIMDFAHAKKYNVAEAIITKMAFNQTRPRKHGKKF